jgi:hypothetical protein
VTPIAGVEFAIETENGEVVWTSCEAVDDSFDSSEEDFVCVLPELEPGEYVILVRTYDEKGAYTIEERYVEAVARVGYLAETGENILPFIWVFGSICLVVSFDVLNRFNLYENLKRMS